MGRIFAAIEPLGVLMKQTKPASSSIEDMPIVPPPGTFTVDADRKPVLYLPDGRVLTRKVGF